MSYKINGDEVINDLQQIVDVGYTNFHASVNSAANSIIDFANPVVSRTLTSNVTYSASNRAEGRTTVINIEMNGNSITGWPSYFEWKEGQEPNWSTNATWQIEAVCWGDNKVRASAIGYPGEGGAFFTNGAEITIDETSTPTTLGFSSLIASSGTLYWNITDDVGGSNQSNSDWVAVNSGGSGTAYTGSAGSFTVDAIADGNVFPAADTGTETFYCHLRSGSDTGTILDTIKIIVNNDSVPAAPTYAITNGDELTGITVAETVGAIAINVATTNVSDGTTLFWNITTDLAGNSEVTTDWTATNSGPTGFDITSVGANGTGSFNITPLEDALVESSEVFYVHLRTGSTSGTKQKTLRVVVTDIAPIYTVTTPPTVIEGNNIVISLAVQNPVPEDLLVFFNASDAAGRFSQFDPGYFVAPSYADISVPTTAVATPQGDVTVTVEVIGVTSGVSDTTTFEFVDNLPSYIVTTAQTTVAEGSNIVIELDVTNSSGEDVDVTITDDGTGRYSTVIADFNSGDGYANRIVTTSTNANTQGSQALTVTVTGVVSGRSDTCIVTLTDQVPTYTLSVAPVTVVEGNSFVVSLAVSGTNIGEDVTLVIDDDLTGRYDASNRTFTSVSGYADITITTTLSPADDPANSVINLVATGNLSSVSDSTTVTLTNLVPVYTISTAANVIEGNSATLELGVTNPVGENVTYTITDDGTGRYSLAGGTFVPAGYADLVLATTSTPAVETNKTVTITVTGVSSGETAQTSFQLLDATPSYTVTTNQANYDEGETITVSLAAVATGGENVTLTISDDGTGRYSAANRTFTSPTYADIDIATSWLTGNQGQKTLTFTATGVSSAISDQTTALLNDRTPSYVVDTTAASVLEGSPIVITLDVTDAVTENVNYTITDDGTGRYSVAGGAFTAPSYSNITLVTTETPANSGTQTLTIEVTGAVSGVTNSCTVQLTDKLPTYTVTTAAASVVEGNDIVIELAVQNPVDEDVNYTISNDGSSRYSVVGGVFTKPSYADITLPTTINAALQGTQTLTITVTGAESGVSDTVTVDLTDLVPVYTLTIRNTGGSSITSISEGSEIALDLGVTNAVGETVSWAVTGDSEARALTSSGDFTSAAYEDASVQIASTASFVGTETWTFTATGDESGVVATDTIDILEGGVTITYGLTAPAGNVVEGTDWSFSVTATLVSTGTYEDFAWVLTDADARFPTTTGTITAAQFSAGSGTHVVTISDCTATFKPEGALLITVEGSGATYGNSASDTFNYVDGAADALYELIVPATEVVEGAGNWSFTLRQTLVNTTTYENTNWALQKQTAGPTFSDIDARFQTTTGTFTAAEWAGGATSTVVGGAYDGCATSTLLFTSILGSATSFDFSPIYQGDITGRIQCVGVNTGQTVSDTVVFVDQDPVIAEIFPGNPASVSDTEGTPGVVMVPAFTNAIPGTTIYYWLSDFTGGLTIDDFVGSPPTSAAAKVAIGTVDSNGTAMAAGFVAPDLTLVNDAIIESPSGYTINVSFGTNTPDFSTVCAVIDDDSSLVVTFDSGNGAITINETDAADVFAFSTTGSTDGTVYWNITTDVGGATQASTADWVAVNSGGAGVTYTSSAGSITVNAVSDSFTEGSETFYLHVRQGSDTGTILDTKQIDVTDDSLTPVSYSISVIPPSGFGNVVEGQNVLLSYAVGGQIGETLAWSITGPNAASRLNATSGTTTAITNSGSQIITFATASNVLYSGTLTCTTTGNVSGVVATDDFEINETSPTWSITADSGTPVDEGTQYTFSITSTNTTGNHYLVFEDISGDVTTADFENPSQGTTAPIGFRQLITCSGNPSSATYTITIKNDAITEATTESFRARIYAAETGGSASSETGVITISDTSQDPPPALVFNINTTAITALATGNGAESIVTAKMRSSGDFTATAFSSSFTATGITPAPNANAWVSSAAQVAGFGDDYQIRVLTRTNPTGVYGSGTLSAGPAVNCTHSTTNNTGGTTGSWNNQATNWARLDSDFTVLIDAAANPGQAFSANRGVDIEIKTYAGTLGLGTTVLEHRINMEAEADDS